MNNKYESRNILLYSWVASTIFLYLIVVLLGVIFGRFISNFINYNT